jgi:transposase
MNNLTNVWVGVDVSKDTLDIHLYPLNKSFKITNTKVGIEKFVKKELSKFDIKQAACEATGSYEKLLAVTFKKHGYPVWIVNPYRIKGYIISTGCKSKNDKIDAKKIAEFASKNTPDYQAQEKTENQEKLRALVSRRDDLTRSLAEEKTRYQQPAHEPCKQSIENMIEHLESQIKEIEKQIKYILKKDEELSARAKILESIPGIGAISAATLLSFFPELGTLNNRKIASLAGLSPFERSSGKHVGKRYIGGGRSLPRKLLYMCALTAIQRYEPLKQFYKRLMDNKKPFKVAIVAVMRKLVVLANTLLKKGEMCYTFN